MIQAPTSEKDSLNIQDKLFKFMVAHNITDAKLFNHTQQYLTHP